MKKKTGQGYKTCSYLTQLSMKGIMLINVKMPKIAGILALTSMIHTTSESLKGRKVLILSAFKLL